MPQMKRLLARPAKVPPTGKRSRKKLLRVLLLLTAALVLAIVGWAYADTSQKPTLSQKVESTVTDYGQVANMLLADDAFPSDSLSSQLKSYILPNFNLQRTDWQSMNAGVNASCPLDYKRLK